MNRKQQAQNIVRDLREPGIGYSLNNRPLHRVRRVPTPLALAPIGTGFPALLLLQAGELAAAAVLGLAALGLFAWACARLEVIWR